MFVSATQEWFKKCTTSTMRNYAEIRLAGREGVWIEREWPTFPMERSSLSKNNTTPSVVKITPKLVIPIPISGTPEKRVRRVQVEFRCSMVGCKKFWCVKIEIKCWEEFSSKPEVIAHFAHRQPCLARMTWGLESVEPSLCSRVCTSIDSCLMSCVSLVKVAFVSFVRFRRCAFVRSLRTSKVPSKVRRYELLVRGSEWRNKMTWQVRTP